MERITVDGRAIAFHRAGGGPPLVLLHGGWSDGREWRLQLGDLSDTFDVVAWDAPGCGGSDDPVVPATVESYVDAVAGLVTALGLGPVHLCGLSFGGGLALAVYDRHPELVRSLILISAYAGWKGSLPADEVRARVDRIRNEVHRPPAEWIDDYLPSFFARPVPPEVMQWTRAIMLDVRPAGTTAMLEAFADADLRAVLPRITVPTLVLHGGADVRAPRSVAEALQAAVPGARRVELAGVGHALPQEAPEAFEREVRRFLAGVP